MLGFFFFLPRNIIHGKSQNCTSVQRKGKWHEVTWLPHPPTSALASWASESLESGSVASVCFISRRCHASKSGFYEPLGVKSSWSALVFLCVAEPLTLFVSSICFRALTNVRLLMVTAFKDLKFQVCHSVVCKLWINPSPALREEGVSLMMTAHPYWLSPVHCP